MPDLIEHDAPYYGGEYGEIPRARPRRGEGRGSNFFVLDRDIWEEVWTAKTANRLNLLTALLVLLAGTGADHRLTKWSAKACEDHAGMGKPRAKLAIEELIAAGLAAHTDASTQFHPQYQMALPECDYEPIFLPVQLVTGFGHETPVLRRVRETGDPYLLRMLIDLYGLIETDATHGVPLEYLHAGNGSEDACRKVMEQGANTVWALALRDQNGSFTRQGKGAWRNIHHATKKDDGEAFWHRVETLEHIGALWLEPWVFASAALDAEPLFPVHHESFGMATPPDDAVMDLSVMIAVAAEALVEETRARYQHVGKFLLPLPTHHQAPAVRGVARLRVEADTPGRRIAYGRRMRAIEARTDAYRQLLDHAHDERYDVPVKLG